MGELILMRNAVLDLGLDVKPSRFCFVFMETILHRLSSDKSKCTTALA
jgi:hypothetical protein